MLIRDCLDQYERAHRAVGGTIHNQVVLGYIRELLEGARDPVQAVFFPGFHLTSHADFPLI